MSIKKRLILATAGVGAVGLFAALGAVGTNALFTADAPDSQSSTIHAGTVSLTDTTNSTTCDVSNAAPGYIPQPCVYTVTNGGDLPVYMQLDISITSAAGAGGTPLYDGTASGLGVSVTSLGTHNGIKAYTVPTVTPYNATNLGVPNGTGASGSSWVFQPGETATFTMLASLPSWSDNAYQGGTATVKLSAHAVQSDNNQCYASACSTATTEIQSVVANSGGNGSLDLTYNKDLNTAPGATPSPSNFYLVDWSQSGATPVTATGASWAFGPGTNEGVLNLTALSNGKTIKSGDYLSLVFKAGNGGSCQPFTATGTQWYPAGNCMDGHRVVGTDGSYSYAQAPVLGQMVSLFKVQ
jgi:hypothetical protein